MKFYSKLIISTFLFSMLFFPEVNAQRWKIFGKWSTPKNSIQTKIPTSNSRTTYSYTKNVSGQSHSYSYSGTGSYSTNYSNRWNTNYRWNNHRWNSRPLNVRKMTVVVGRNNKVITNSKAATQVTRTNKTPVSNSRKNEIENLIQKKSKNKNKLLPIKKDNGDKLTAIGDHTAFKRNSKGVVYKYESYKKESKNNFTPQKRYDGGHPDGKKGKPHKNNSGEYVSTPHIQGKSIKEGVRKPMLKEIPKSSKEILSEKK